MKFLYRVKKKFFSFFQSVFQKIGLDVFRRRFGNHYVPDYYGRSSHKQQDLRMLPVFGDLASAVLRDGYCSLYYDRLFTIYGIIDNLKSFSNSLTMQMAEVGVYKGGTSYFIASLADRLELNYRHYCFDTFQGHDVKDINQAIEIFHASGTFGDTSFEAVQQYLRPFEKVSVYKGRFQDQCDVLENIQFNFVHLDMDIYEPTIFALKFFDEKMVKGGVILLDDFGFETCPGISKAVWEFTLARKNFFGMALLTGQYILVKL